MPKRYGPKPQNYTPQNKEKYTGSYPIVSRSSWELATMRYFDTCSKCISWQSESAVVRYYDPVKRRQRRYFIDFTATFETKDNEIKKFYIEVKPYKETILPKASKRKKPKTLLIERQKYITNQAKWEAAEKWARSRGAYFMVITEKDIFKNL